MAPICVSASLEGDAQRLTRSHRESSTACDRASPARLSPTRRRVPPCLDRPNRVLRPGAQSAEHRGQLVQRHCYPRLRSLAGESVGPSLQADSCRSQVAQSEDLDVGRRDREAASVRSGSSTTEMARSSKPVAVRRGVGRGLWLAMCPLSVGSVRALDRAAGRSER